jgi:hypothetical protein
LVAEDEGKASLRSGGVEFAGRIMDTNRRGGNQLGLRGHRRKQEEKYRKSQQRGATHICSPLARAECEAISLSRPACDRRTGARLLE